MRWAARLSAKMRGGESPPNVPPEQGAAGAASGDAYAIVGHEITRRYGDGQSAVKAVRRVSLQAPKGQFTAIMGPSGSGKSTLMHLLAGLDRPTSGRVQIAGKEITGLDDAELTLVRREHVGFVFQAFNLLPMLSAEENIALPLKLARRRIDQRWVASVIDRVGLAQRRHHRPAELSGGQQQRVAIARALISQPAIVFADEPTGNLDSRSSAEVLALLRDTVDSYGQTTLMVTHDPAAAAVTDRVLFLADGRIVLDLDRPDESAVLAAMKGLS